MTISLLHSRFRIEINDKKLLPPQQKWQQNQLASNYFITIDYGNVFWFYETSHISLHMEHIQGGNHSNYKWIVEKNLGKMGRNWK